MATRVRLGVEERMRVVVPNKEGYSLKSIAERLKIGRRTVQEIVKEYAERGSVPELRGKGEKEKDGLEEGSKDYADEFKVHEKVLK